MKNWIIIMSVLLFSCSEVHEKKKEIETAKLSKQLETNSTEEYLGDKKNEEFRSDLRLGKTDWNEEETFIDTLELVEYNADFDYAYAVFRTSEGKEITINTNIEIDNYSRNRNVEVTWKVGKYYEAGEGDALYFKEQLISFEILTSSYSFENFLTTFSKDYKTGTQAAITKYINPKVELVSTYNLGLYCVTERRSDLPRPTYFNETFIITNKKPTGDFCNGYNGVEDGLYYEFIDETQLPTFDDMSEEGGKVNLYIESGITYFYFAKVIVIIEEHFNRCLYFFNGNDKWYFWVEDSCDCSG